jgi:general secretion pathway protein E
MAARGSSKGASGRALALRDRVEPASTLVTDEWSRVARAFEGFDLSPEQLKQFARTPGSDDEPWDVMLSLLALDEHQALTILSKRTGMPFELEPKLEDSASRFYELIPGDVARSHHVAGVSADHLGVLVATAQPMQPAIFSLLEDLLQAPIRLLLSPRAAVQNLINRGYEQRGDLVTEIIDEMPLDERAIETAAGSIGQSTDLLQLARQTPVIRLVNMILFEALRRRASDIHVHPQETRLVIRFRIDGILHDVFTPPLTLAPAISSRMKVMTELDIANRHAPQDGHTSVRVGQRKVDIRLSCIPTVYGERLVLRLLDQTQTQLSLDDIGMSKAMQGQLMDVIDRPTGMVLVTGPTGSGKTTTLYAALGRIDRATRNVMTIEDPVEYHLEGISQMQVNPKRGVTFATGLRALLRQDPDVILVGEIRDKETAQLAVQASLTGHFVLATLHTNDAPGSIPRLIDIGIEPYLITSSLMGVLAQRLLRRTCVACSGRGSRDDHTRCERCFGTGYRGRLAVYEFMMIDDTLRRLTESRADGVSLREAALDAGFKPMRDDAMLKVEQGVTDQSEVYRVLH